MAQKFQNVLKYHLRKQAMKWLTALTSSPIYIICWGKASKSVAHQETYSENAFSTLFISKFYWIKNIWMDYWLTGHALFPPFLSFRIMHTVSVLLQKLHSIIHLSTNPLYRGFAMAVLPSISGLKGSGETNQPLRISHH